MSNKGENELQSEEIILNNLCTNIRQVLSKAKAFQNRISKKIILEKQETDVNTVAGFDVAYKNDRGYAIGVVMDTKTKRILQQVKIIDKIDIEYIPTYLFLREVPFFIKLYNKLRKKPDVVLIDGHGIAHPSFSGSASIFGVIKDIPTIGIAKKPLLFEIIPTEETYDKIFVRKKHVGYFIHDKDLYISPGNKISLKYALNLTLKLLDPCYKLPLPLYLADQKSKKLRENHHK